MTSPEFLNCPLPPGVGARDLLQRRQLLRGRAIARLGEVSRERVDPHHAIVSA